MNRIRLTLASLLVAAGGSAYAGGVDPERLAAVLAGQPQAVQSRYAYRHPQETLEFFGIAPGMTVVEALPGSGWYSKILRPYLGSAGGLIGADYAVDMYRLFGFFGEDFIEKKKTWVTDWPADAAEWSGDEGASVSAFVFGAMPDEMKGTADAVLFIRALHNLARFEPEGAYLTTALQNAFDVLKPGGVVGVVQHQARDDMPDDWASGRNGYLKREFLIARMEAAGFEFMAESAVNQNPEDRPAETDQVWRLPPSLSGSGDDPERKAEMQAIGESNRMTLKFRKP
jgi:predicted methyltransferase